MLHTKIGAGAGDTDPANSLTPDASLHSKNWPEKQRLTPQIQGLASIADWRDLLVQRGYFETVEVVTGELGPVHVLGSPAPRVMVGTRGGSTFCWIVNAPWGWDNLSREFLRVPSKAAAKYALELAAKLRDEAQRKFQRQERARDSRLRELIERRSK